MKRYFVAISLLFCVLVAGCVTSLIQGEPETYQFPNRGEPIERVELLYNPYAQNGYTEKPFVHIRWLNEEEVSGFMERIYDLKTKDFVNPPVRNCGRYVVEVNYKNGDTELFSSWHIQFSAAGSDTDLRVGEYTFWDRDAFEALFTEYAGTEDFSEYDPRELTTLPTSGEKPEKEPKDPADIIGRQGDGLHEP